MRNRLLGSLLAIVLIAGLIPTFPHAAEAVEMSGFYCPLHSDTEMEVWNIVLFNELGQIDSTSQGYWCSKCNKTYTDPMTAENTWVRSVYCYVYWKWGEGLFRTIVYCFPHVYGSWYPVTQPQVGVAGLERHDCTNPWVSKAQQYGDTPPNCTKYETRAIPALPPPEPGVNHAPVASFTVSPTNPNTGVSVSYANNSYDADGDTLTAHWTVAGADAGTSWSGPNVSSWSSSGSRTIALTVTDPGGLSGSTSVTVAVQAPPATDGSPIAAFTVTPTSVGVNQPVTIRNTSYHPYAAYGHYIQYQEWYIGKEFVSSNRDNPGTGPNLDRWPWPTTVTVTLYVYDENYKSSSASQSITVTDTRPPVARFTATSPITVNQRTTVTNTSYDPGNKALTYAWSVDDVPAGSSPTGPSVTSWPAPGLHVISLAVTNSAGFTSTPCAQAVEVQAPSKGGSLGTIDILYNNVGSAIPPRDTYGRRGERVDLTVATDPSSMISAVRIHFPAQSKVLYDNWFEVQGRQYSYASWQDMALTPDESGAVFAGHFTIPWTVDGLAFKTFVADGSYPIELQGFDMSGSLVARSKVNIIVQGGMTFVLGQ